MNHRERAVLWTPGRPPDRSGRALSRALLAVDAIVGACLELDERDQEVLAARLEHWPRWLPDAGRRAS